MDMLVFILIAFAGAYMIDFLLLIPNSSSQLIFQLGASLRMLMPAAGVIAAYHLDRRASRNSLGLNIGRPFWIFVAPFIPLSIWLLAILLQYTFNLPIRNPEEIITLLWQPALKQEPDNTKVQTLFQLMQSYPLAGLLILITLSLFAGSTVNAFFALGEEIGWRGFLISRLFTNNFYLQTLIIGILWGLWHAPLVWITGYNYLGYTGPVPALTFMIATVSMSYALNGLRYVSGSVIPPAIVHGTFNALGAFMLLSLPGNTLISGVAGIIPSSAWLIAGIFIDIIRHRTKAINEQEPYIT